MKTKEEITRYNQTLSQQRMQMASNRDELSRQRDKLLSGRDALERFKDLKDKNETRWLAQRMILNYFDKAYTGITSMISDILHMVDKVQEKLGVEREYWTLERYKGNLEEKPLWTDKLLDEVFALYNAGSNIGNSTGSRWDSPVGISTAGGGVGTVGSPLKRKPDEDDEAFLYRCVVMACMKAKKNTGVKRGI